MVYRFYGTDGTLLYVGYTVDFARRIQAHKLWSPWFPQADTYTIAKFDTVGAALRAEMLAIRNEGPRHNIIGNKGWTQAAADLGGLLSPLRMNDLNREVAIQRCWDQMA